MPAARERAVDRRREHRLTAGLAGCERGRSRAVRPAEGHRFQDEDVRGVGVESVLDGVSRQRFVERDRHLTSESGVASEVGFREGLFDVGDTCIGEPVERRSRFVTAPRAVRVGAEFDFGTDRVSNGGNALDVRRDRPRADFDFEGCEPRLDHVGGFVDGLLDWAVANCGVHRNAFPMVAAEMAVERNARRPRARVAERERETVAGGRRFVERVERCSPPIGVAGAFERRSTVVE